MGIREIHKNHLLLNECTAKRLLNEEKILNIMVWSEYNNDELNEVAIGRQSTAVNFMLNHRHQ